VAGHDDADRIAPGRRAGSTRAARGSCAASQLAVADGLAVRDAGDGPPHRLLERRPGRIERDVEPLALAGEVLGELALRLSKEFIVSVAHHCASSFGKYFWPWKYTPAIPASLAASRICPCGLS
jgi:hypothetical protein